MSSFIQGFLSYFSNDSLLDDNSVLNLLLHLLVLLKDWDGEDINRASFKSDIVMKISSKLDSLILIFLGRANPRIRKTSLLILLYADKIFRQIVGPKKSSLLSIILNFENIIIKESILAFGKDHLAQYALSESVISGLDCVGFFEVAFSNYLHLYRYYYGSLSKLFAKHGDNRSICHMYLYMNAMVLPRMQIVPKSAGSLFNLSTATVLLLAFGGAPVMI